MSRWERFRSLEPFAQGALGALTVAIVLAAGVWFYNRYAEHEAMLGWIVQQSQQQKSQGVQKPAEVPAK